MSMLPLPEDVLFSIFELVSWKGSYGVSGTSDWKSLLAVYHTCFYWRTVSSMDFRAWAMIDYSKMPPRIVSLFLERCQHRPLQIVWRQFQNTNPFLPSQEWIDKLPELRSLDITTSATALTTLPTLHAPSLISCSLTSWDFSMVSFQDSTLILPNLFEGSTPGLRYLALLGLRMPWLPGRYTGLTTLRIHTSGIPCVADQDFLSIFRDSPSLELLNIVHPRPLRWNTPWRPDSSAKPSELIPMRYLKSLSIQLPRSDICRMLSNVLTPEHMELLSVHATQSAEADGQLLPCNADCLPVLRSLRSLHIKMQQAQIVGSDDPSDPAKPSVVLSQCGIWDADKFSNDVQSLMSMLGGSSTDLRVVSFASNLTPTHVDKSLLTTLLRGARNSNELTLSNILRSTFEEWVDEIRLIGWPCMHITHLSLDNMTFSSRTLLSLVQTIVDSTDGGFSDLSISNCVLRGEREQGRGLKVSRVTAPMVREHIRELRRPRMPALTLRNVKMKYTPRPLPVWRP